MKAPPVRECLGLKKLAMERACGVCCHAVRNAGRVSVCGALHVEVVVTSPLRSGLRLSASKTHRPAATTSSMAEA